MGDYRKLLRILQKELSYQEKILELLGSERAAIINLQRDRIDDLKEQKEKLINEALALERERSAALDQLKSPAADAPVKFSDLVEGCDEPAVQSKLRQIGGELKLTAESVRALNQENGVLIKQSLGLISSTIAIMRSTPSADLPTYRQSGKLAGSEDPAFARRSMGVSRSA